MRVGAALNRTTGLVILGPPASEHSSPKTDPLREALEKQGDEDAHDRSLIVERLAWTPEQRLEANAAFLRFYLSVRPQGPLIRDE